MTSAEFIDKCERLNLSPQALAAILYTSITDAKQLLKSGPKFYTVSDSSKFVQHSKWLDAVFTRHYCVVNNLLEENGTVILFRYKNDDELWGGEGRPLPACVFGPVVKRLRDAVGKNYGETVFYDRTAYVAWLGNRVDSLKNRYLWAADAYIDQTISAVEFGD